MSTETTSENKSARKPDFSDTITFKVFDCDVTCHADIAFVDRVERQEERGYDIVLSGRKFTRCTITKKGELGFFLWNASEGENDPTDAHEFMQLEMWIAQRMPTDKFWARFYDEADEAVIESIRASDALS